MSVALLFISNMARLEKYSFSCWNCKGTYIRFKNCVVYSESKYCLRISLAHHRDCHFTHVQWLPLSIEKPQTPFREIRVMFMFVPVR